MHLHGALPRLPGTVAVPEAPAQHGQRAQEQQRCQQHRQGNSCQQATRPHAQQLQHCRPSLALRQASTLLHEEVQRPLCADLLISVECANQCRRAVHIRTCTA